MARSNDQSTHTKSGKHVKLLSCATSKGSELLGLDNGSDCNRCCSKQQEPILPRSRHVKLVGERENPTLTEQQYVQVLRKDISMLSQQVVQLESKYIKHYTGEKSLNPYSSSAPDRCSSFQHNAVSVEESLPPTKSLAVSAGAQLSLSIRDIQSKIYHLDRIFHRVAYPDQNRQIAATTIAAAYRRHITNKSYKKCKLALSQWRTQSCSDFFRCLDRFIRRERYIEQKIDIFAKSRDTKLLKTCMTTLQDLRLALNSVRIHQRAEADKRFAEKLERTLKSRFAEWKASANGVRSRKNIARDVRRRHREARQRLERVNRFDVITPEMIHQEFLKENIRYARDRHKYHILHIYFKILVLHEYTPYKAKELRACKKAQTSLINKIWRSWKYAAHNSSRNEVDEAISPRVPRITRTLPRYKQHYNYRDIDLHYHHNILRKHIQAWTNQLALVCKVRRSFEVNVIRDLRRIFRIWQIRARYQRRLRGIVISSWRSFCRRLYAVPFQAWYIYLSERHSTIQAGKKICLAYDRLRRRRVIYNFFRIWSHQSLFKNVDGIHSHVSLLQALADQKRLCNALELDAEIHKKTIASLQGSLDDAENRVIQLYQELADMHKGTQTTRFAMHQAEQSIAKLFGILDAVRQIHPHTLARIENMFEKNAFLSCGLQQLMEVQLDKRKQLLNDIATNEIASNVLRAGCRENASADAPSDAVVMDRTKQLLLRRVEWVLSRIDLHYAEDPDNTRKTRMRMMNGMEWRSQAQSPYELCTEQLFALFEFIRNGNTDRLQAGCRPSLNDRLDSDTRNAYITSESNDIVVCDDVIDKSNTWYDMARDLTTHFSPQRLVSVRERIALRAADLEKEIGCLQQELHSYHAYTS